jgi:hypothetical protein
VKYVDGDVQRGGGRQRARHQWKRASDGGPRVLDGARAVIPGAGVAGGEFLGRPRAREPFVDLIEVVHDLFGSMTRAAAKCLGRER